MRTLSPRELWEQLKANLGSDAHSPDHCQCLRLLTHHLCLALHLPPAVEDLLSNFLKKRVVISINTVGMQAWTLIVNLKDTPEGLKNDAEQVIGMAANGYDPADPAKGMPREFSQVMNDNLIKPALQQQTPGDEFMRSTNAITRHVVEEFSMFRFFLPQVCVCVCVSAGGGGVF